MCLFRMLTYGEHVTVQVRARSAGQAAPQPSHLRIDQTERVAGLPETRNLKPETETQNEPESETRNLKPEAHTET